MAAKFEKPSWAVRIDSLNVRPAMNGWVVNLSFVGPEKAGSPPRWQDEQYIFEQDSDMSAFVKDAKDSMKKG